MRPEIWRSDYQPDFSEQLQRCRPLFVPPSGWLGEGGGSQICKKLRIRNERNKYLKQGYQFSKYCFDAYFFQIKQKQERDTIYILSTPVLSPDSNPFFPCDTTVVVIGAGQLLLRYRIEWPFTPGESLTTSKLRPINQQIMPAILKIVCSRLSYEKICKHNWELRCNLHVCWLNAKINYIFLGGRYPWTRCGVWCWPPLRKLPVGRCRW